MTTMQKSKALTSTLIKWIASTLVVALLAGGGYLYFRSTSQTASTPRSLLQTVKATVGDLTLFASGTGTIVPVAESNLSFNTSGQVTAIAVKIGDHVEAGQVLAQLDDKDAKVNLAQAQEAMHKLTSASAIATAKQNLTTAQTSFVNAKKALEYLISPEVLYWEENVAQREQILADAKTASQTDTSNATKKKVSDAEASLRFAQDSLKYFQAVYTYTYIPANFTQYHTVRGKTVPVQVTDTLTGLLVDEVYPPTVGEIGIARSAYDLAKASIAEAQAYLDVLNGADISDEPTGANLVTYTQTKHALETAQYNLKATQLIAPISGTISALSINVGDLATSGSSVITISNYDQPYLLDAFTDAKNWGEIRNGYVVETTFDILPDQVFKGVVTNIYPTLDTTSSNSALVHFTARLNTAIPYNLPASSSASINVIGGNATHAVLIPIEALHQAGDGKYAVFVLANGTLRLRLVQVGVLNLTKAEIISGLKAGEVVTTGVVKTK